MPEGNVQVASTTDAPEIVAAQEETARSEEATIARERVENGNGKHVPRAVDKRIDKLTRQRQEAREEAAQLRERLAQIEAERNGHTAQVEPQRNAAPEEHAEDSAQAVTVNEAAKVEQPATQRAEERKAPEPEATPQDSPSLVTPEVKQAHLARVAEAKKKYSDWDELAARLPANDVDISAEAELEIAKAQNSADVIHALMSNPEVSRHIASLNPEQQREKIREISTTTAFHEKLAASSTKPELAEIAKAIAEQHPAALIATSLLQEINAIPNGTAVFKALLKDNAECQRLSQMSQTGAAIELGRMSARLEGNTPRQVVSSAPPPIKPLGGHGVRAAVDLNDPNLPYADYVKERDKQEKNYRRNGETVYAEYKRS